LPMWRMMEIHLPELTWRGVDSGFYHLAVGHESSLSVKEGIDYLLHLRVYVNTGYERLQIYAWNA
jgi:hypothetical protein